MTGHGNDNDHLEHYGVKGMKWGIRRRRGSDGRVTDSPRARRKDRGRTTFQKSPNRLSDEELQKRIRRLELEKKYRDLNAPTVSKGRKFASEAMQNSGKAAIGTAVGATTSFAVQRALKRKFGG